MISVPNSTESVSENGPTRSITVEPYLQAALSTCNSSGLRVSLFPTTLSATANSTSSAPALCPDTQNNLLLFPGLFNPPHQGHLATIRYLFKHRKQLEITSTFLFADPSNIIRTKDKKWTKIVLPQELRNSMIAAVPEISQLIAEKWLFIFYFLFFIFYPFNVLY